MALAQITGYRHGSPNKPEVILIGEYHEVKPKFKEFQRTSSNPDFCRVDLSILNPSVSHRLITPKAEKEAADKKAAAVKAAAEKAAKEAAEKTADQNPKGKAK